MTEPLSYSSPPESERDPAATRETIYRILLGVFGGLVLFSGGLSVAILHSSPNIAHWVLIYLACCYAAVALGSFGVLALRILKPRRFRWVTLAWNILMIPFFPFGTALGIYGIVVLDKYPIVPASDPG